MRLGTRSIIVAVGSGGIVTVDGSVDDGVIVDAFSFLVCDVCDRLDNKCSFLS